MVVVARTARSWPIVVVVYNGRLSISNSKTTSVIAIFRAVVPSVITVIYIWTLAVEVPWVVVTGVYTPCPCVVIIIERTIEVVGTYKVVVLSWIKNIEQVAVSSVPIAAIEVIGVVNAHEIIEIYLINGCILSIGQT